jgi:hypothetical protein
MTLRMPPFSLRAMVEAWWRALSFKWFGRPAIERQVNEVNKLGNGGPQRPISPARPDRS